MTARTGSDFRRTWHSDSDAVIRRRVLSDIYTTLTSPATASEQLTKIQVLAKRFEATLYRNAQSLDEYQNKETLRSRVMSMWKSLVPSQQEQDGVQARTPSNRLAQSNGSHMADEQAFAPTIGPDLRSNSMAHGASAMIPAPTTQASQWMRGGAADGGAPARMMPTPTLEGPVPSTSWASNGYNTRPAISDGSAYIGMDDPMRASRNGRTYPQMGMLNAQVPSGIAPNPSTSPTPSNNGRATSIPSNQSTTTSQRQHRHEQFRKEILRQQRLLLYLRHCAKCRSPNCVHGNDCATGRALWQHVIHCSNDDCTYPRCVHARSLLRHYQKCTKSDCPVCSHTRQYVESARVQPSRVPNAQQVPQSMALVQPSMPSSIMPSNMPTQQMLGNLTPSSSFGPGGIMMNNGVPNGIAQPPGCMQHHGYVVANHPHAVKREADTWEPGPLDPRADIKRIRALPPTEDHKNRDMAEIKKNLGASLLEMFTVDQIEMHLRSTAADMARAPPPKGSQPQGGPEEQCHICKAQHILRFEPPPKNCVSCGARIKRNQTYYQHFKPDAIWCQACFNAAGDNLYVENLAILKGEVADKKQRNEQHEDEEWVNCDNPNCNKWVHIICGLFNKGSNSSNTCYLCPWCLSKEKETGRWDNSQARPQSMATAQDLPTTQLSNFIEKRLQKCIDSDWRSRQEQQLDPAELESLGVEGLTVRVVNITNKVVEVKRKFADHLKGTGYPSHFPFKQKVILLFQRIEGVDVLLFIVYVQEYGGECGAPNCNTCYLSYLDSVKYFRPETRRAANDRAMRTMVYHEVLLGYMEHAKKLGMNAMYIWSCPPLAGDDYVIYCHPSKQKNPRASHLREWYHSLLDEAARRGIVTFRSSLYDSFFEGGKDHALTEVSSQKLPYFDGDFWPGEAETRLNEISSGKAPANIKKGRGKNTGKGKRYPGPVTTDQQLMQHLADHSIGSNQNGMKEDFIVAHFRTPCSLCAGYCDAEEATNDRVQRVQWQWVLNKSAADLPRTRQFDGIEVDEGTHERPDLPRHFAVCTACYAREEALPAGSPSTLPKNVSLADLMQAPCDATAAEIPDADKLKFCDIFDSRTSYLIHCQTNHLQFDTLRRAKHSSMMTLFHLHNQDIMNLTSCSFCQGDVPAGTGYRCETCTDVESCETCYHAGSSASHNHPLVKVPKIGSKFTTSKSPGVQQEREEMLRRTMTLLEHASSCNSKTCQSKSCRKVKKLHAHARVCEKKVQGGCVLCRHMWLLLNLHAKQCVKKECPVPRCQELRELRRRQHDRQENARRAKYLTWQRGNQGSEGANGPGSSIPGPR